MLSAQDTTLPNGAVFHYVPILQTIKALFTDASVQKQYCSPEASNADYYDLRDGFVFKNNSLFQIYGCKALQIILYADEFEVCNPLGQGKRKHKILAVYFTIGNLHVFSRSKVDGLQLVLLCKQCLVKTSTIKAVFEPLIQELKVLETTGIDLGLGINTFGSVICVTGDNLGSHWLGGFSTNFSSGEHFYRVCSIKRLKFLENALAENTLRTPDMYDADAIVAENSGNIKTGVKFSSPLNNLRYFHVCQPGLPPCLAHDVFEGVIAYDLVILIKHYISKKWLSLEYLNHQIENFPYSAEEKLSKPCLIKKISNKLSGNACQNWCMLRLFLCLLCPKLRIVMIHRG